ncbi:MAG: AraC family transcriptional regulator, partial [Sporomusaceae bacterium]|nr:AraC family transcriptional regulator [Sporomusaceae bacterium]
MKNTVKITCQRVNYDRQQLHDIHEYAQLSIPLVGRKVNIINGISIEHTEDFALYIPPNSWHETYVCGEEYNQFLMFNIPLVYLLEWHNKIKFINYFDKKWVAAKQLIELEVGKEANDSAIIADIFMYLLNMLCHDEFPNSLKYIHNNYTQKITIKELAAIENYNPTYYCEWFVKKFSQTPLQYMTSLRMEKAKRLLADTNFTVLQIAVQLGYESESSFSKKFFNYQ